MSENIHNFTVGAELEFYLFDSKMGGLVSDESTGKFPQKFYDLHEEYKAKIVDLFADFDSYDYEMKQESGPGQFEVQFKHFKTVDELANNISEFKYLAEKLKVKYGLEFSYHPKPLEGHTGSGLHIHICTDAFDPYGLIANGGFMQAKRDSDNDHVLWAVGGLLAKVKKDLPIFLPTPESRLRLVDFMNAPTKICWGRNNRSVLVRIPDGKPKRLEHRLAGSDSDPKAVAEAVIAAAIYGIENKIVPPEPIWGNAWDKKHYPDLESVLG